MKLYTIAGLLIALLLSLITIYQQRQTIRANNDEIYVWHLWYQDRNKTESVVPCVK